MVEKRDILHEAVSHSQADFEKKLKELARSDPRIEFHIGHNSSSGFTSFVSIDGQLIKGCRVYISADFNGLTYDGNTYYAVQWEFDEIRRQMKEINRQISGNLQAVIDGDANVAAFVRSLDRQHEGLRKQLQERKSMLNQLGHMSGIQEGDNSYTLRTTVGKLDGKPVLEFLPAPEMTDESPDSRICTLEDAAERLWKAFVGDTISQPLSEP